MFNRYLPYVLLIAIYDKINDNICSVQQSSYHVVLIENASILNVRR